MKILRSVTRRGFTVGTAGMFTIVSPNRWFAASHLPESFLRFGARSKVAAAPVAASGKAPGGVDGQTTATSPQIMILGTQDRRPMRFALVALLATAIAFFVLWWFFHTAVGWPG